MFRLDPEGGGEIQREVQGKYRGGFFEIEGGGYRLGALTISQSWPARPVYSRTEFRC